MAEFCDLESMKMHINRYYRYITIGDKENTYYFTEVDDLEEVIKVLQDMLGIWREGLACKPTDYAKDID